MIIAELASIAFADRTEIAKVVKKPIKNFDGEFIIDENGEIIEEPTVEVAPTDAISNASKKCISGVKMGRNGIEVTTYDKVKALELLGKHFGAFVDKKAEQTETGVQIIDDIE